MTAQNEAKKGFLVCIAGPYHAIRQESGQAFGGANECIALLKKVADVVELVPTNSRAARSEWSGAGLPACTIMPTRRRDVSVCLAELLNRGYGERATLLVGFGEKDRDAAEGKTVYFYPILPGREEVCWQELMEEALPKLLHGTYGGRYQQLQLARHDSFLKELK